MTLSTRTVVGSWGVTGGGSIRLAVSVGQRPPADAPPHVVAAMERFRVMVEIDVAGPMPADKRRRMPFACLRATPAELRELYAIVGRAVEMMEQQGGKTNG